MVAGEFLGQGFDAAISFRAIISELILIGNPQKTECFASESKIFVPVWLLKAKDESSTPLIERMARRAE